MIKIVKFKSIQEEFKKFNILISLPSFVLSHVGASRTKGKDSRHGGGLGEGKAEPGPGAGADL